VRETNLVSDTYGLEVLLDTIRSQVASRRIDVYPLFKDFDRRHGFTKGVTMPQFRRLLNQTLNMTFTPTEATLLQER